MLSASSELTSLCLKNSSRSRGKAEQFVVQSQEHMKALQIPFCGVEWQLYRIPE